MEVWLHLVVGKEGSSTSIRPGVFHWSRLGRMCPPGVDQSGRLGPRLKSWQFVTVYGVTCLFCVVASPVLVPVWTVAALQGPSKRSWRETKEKRRRKRCEKQKQGFLEEDSD